MINALVAAALLGAPGEDPIPTSFAMYVDLFQPSIIVNTSGVSATPVSAAVELGAVVNAQHAMTVGLGFSSSPTGSSTSIAVTFNPTYRLFFTPLHPQGFSPFVEGQVFVGYSSGSNFGTNATSIPFGVGAAFGGEYLFARNFGILAEAGVRFEHVTITSNFGGPGDSNALGLFASAALSMHF
jgi:hypothetical protein